MVSKDGDIKACAASNGQNLIQQHINSAEVPEVGGAALPQVAV
jgi:hypothetical protein